MNEQLKKPLYGAVLDTQSKVTRNKKPYYRLLLKIPNEIVNCNIWNISNNDSPIKKGSFVVLNNFEDQRKEHNSLSSAFTDINIISVDTIPQEDRELICETEKAPPELLDKSWNFLNNYESLYQNSLIVDLVKECFSNYDTDFILNCPAAKSIHHEYAGGLVVHTAEVLLHAITICKSINKTYNLCDQDIVCASATLHDLGKLETYYIDHLGAPSSKDLELSIGHIYYSMELVRKSGIKIGTPPQIINEIVHCIASHHGKTEYGAIKEPMSIEAVVVSQADYISARCATYDKQLKKLKNIKTDLNELNTISCAGNSNYIITDKTRKYYDKL